MTMREIELCQVLFPTGTCRKLIGKDAYGQAFELQDGSADEQFLEVSRTVVSNVQESACVTFRTARCWECI